ncbi:MAG: hypothetical protein DLM71_06475 [Chloroflexi bacterium]|nr:MAG: hypothetical protein DLM71_06475 [Chloroflexota bacterium]
MSITFVELLDRWIARTPVVTEPEPTWGMIDLADDALVAAWIRIGELESERERLADELAALRAARGAS